PIITINGPVRLTPPPPPPAPPSPPTQLEYIARAPSRPVRAPSDRAPAPIAPDTEVGMPLTSSDSEPPIVFDEMGEPPTPVAGVPRKLQPSVPPPRMQSSRPPQESYGDSEDIPVDEDVPSSGEESSGVEVAFDSEKQKAASPAKPASLPPIAHAAPAAPTPAVLPVPSKVPMKPLKAASALPPSPSISPVATTIMTPLAASPAPAAITPVSIPVVPPPKLAPTAAKAVDIPPPPPPARVAAHPPPPPPPPPAPPAAIAGPPRRVSVPPPPIGISSSPHLPDPPSPQGGMPVVTRPLVVLPAVSAGLAPPPMNEAAAARKKARPWWEELFNDDFIRTMAKITDAQIAREADFIEDSLGVAKAAMVLDLGCGTGRHAIELTRRGYQVAGFDLSLAMLARAADEAQERNQKLNFLQGDMREMTFEDTFDGIYCWNTSFGFFEEEKNAQVVARVHKALRKSGQFLLDVINRDFLIRQAPSLAWFEGEGCICMDEMAIDWITSRMRVKRTMMMDDGRSKEIEYSIRVYSLHELGKILHDQGFRVAEVSGRVGTPGVFFGAESPRTLIL
ncbi:MAG: methyltransferase domain-containing protein, partial [Polyangiaceae bacterium]